MYLDTHFNIHARKQLIKEGHIWKAITLRVVGYLIRAEGVVLQFPGQIMFPLTALPYDLAYYTKCHQSGVHEEHWTSKRQLKRDVYTIEICSESEILTIETTNAQAYRCIRTQYDALMFMTPPLIRYEDWEFDMSGNYQGISHFSTRTSFPSLQAYETNPDIIKLVEDENH